MSVCPSQQFTQRDFVCSGIQFSLCIAVSEKRLLQRCCMIDVVLADVSSRLPFPPPHTHTHVTLTSCCAASAHAIPDTHQFLNFNSVAFCAPRQVAILVPFRNRHEHLPILLRHLVPVLQNQRLQFAFYLIEQVWTHTLSLSLSLASCQRQAVVLFLLVVFTFHFGSDKKNNNKFIFPFVPGWD